MQQFFQLKKTSELIQLSHHKSIDENEARIPFAQLKFRARIYIAANILTFPRQFHLTYPNNFPYL